MKKTSIVILSVIPFLLGCQPTEYMAESLQQYKAEKMKKNKENISINRKNNNYKSKIRKGTELTCRVQDLSYNSPAYCHNESNSIEFYTTYKKIKTRYKIVHSRSISTHLGNMKGLPNGELAHLELWITRK